MTFKAECGERFATNGIAHGEVVDYVEVFYYEDRTHLGIGKDAPVSRQVELCPAGFPTVRGRSRLGGLHHRYLWHTAA